MFLCIYVCLYEPPYVSSRRPLGGVYQDSHKRPQILRFHVTAFLHHLDLLSPRCRRAAAALPWLPPRFRLGQRRAANAKLPPPPATALPAVLPAVLLPQLMLHCCQAAAAAAANALPPPRRRSATTISVATLPPPSYRRHR
jgi:hypothetical protein